MNCAFPLSPLIRFAFIKIHIFLMKIKYISKSFSYGNLKIQAFLPLASKHFPPQFCPCTHSCFVIKTEELSHFSFSSSERLANLDLSAIFHQHNNATRLFFHIDFSNMLKNFCLMTYIEHIFIEFENTTS